MTTGEASVHEELAKLESALSAAAAPVLTRLAPGLPPDAIARRFRDVLPHMRLPDDLVTWFGWRNGLVDLATANSAERRLVTWQVFSLDEAIRFWQEDLDAGRQDWVWDPFWLPLAQIEGLPYLAADCSPAPPGAETIVASISGDLPLFGDHLTRMSLGQVIRWWRESLDNKIFRYEKTSVEDTYWELSQEQRVSGFFG